MELIAPNQKTEVAHQMQLHPEIDTKNEEKRGAVLDYICAALNAPGTDRPWGRKARRSDGSRLNTDGLTFLRPDGLFEIYDVISGTTGKATWTGYGPFKQGENGYWAPAKPVAPTPDQPQPAPEPTPSPIGEVSAQLDALIARLDTLEQKVDTFTARKLRVRGSTSRDMWHAHQINLEVFADDSTE